MDKTNICISSGWSFSPALYVAVCREQPPSHHSLQDDAPRGSHRGRCPQTPKNRLHLQAEDARCRQQCGIEHRPPQEGDGFWRQQ